ncbi:hypothetical protein KEJ48_01700 [Candidatus Bathyarchaeota archaeon]|nr:hypothetical protein [Candidatus Bathyarchaeota archaeon]
MLKFTADRLLLSIFQANFLDKWLEFVKLRLGYVLKNIFKAYRTVAVER